MVALSSRSPRLSYFKGRRIRADKPVKIYRNLTKKDGVWYSIEQDGLVVAHATHGALDSCSFHVNENGRQRVVAKRKKEVHAKIKGYWAGTDCCKNNRKVKYNPYKQTHFECRNKRIDSASRVNITPTGVYV